MPTEVKTTITLIFRPDAVLEVSVQEKLEERYIDHYKSMGYSVMELELGIPFSEEWVKHNKDVIEAAKLRQKGRLI